MSLEEYQVSRLNRFFTKNIKRLRGHYGDFFGKIGPDVHAHKYKVSIPTWFAKRHNFAKHVHLMEVFPYERQGKSSSPGVKYLSKYYSSMERFL